MSRNERKWRPLPQGLEDLLKRLEQQNKDQIDEANKPPPSQEEQVN